MKKYFTKKVLLTACCSLLTLVVFLSLYTFVLAPNTITPSMIENYPSVTFKEVITTYLNDDGRHEPFYLEYHPCSPFIFALLFQAADKDTLTLQDLRDHPDTSYAMVTLEMLEGQPISVVKEKLINLIESLTA